MLRKTDSIMWNDGKEVFRQKDKLFEKYSWIKKLLVQNRKYLYSSFILQVLSPNLTLHKSKTFKIFIESHVIVIYNNCICISQNWTTIAKRDEHVINMIVLEYRNVLWTSRFNWTVQSLWRDFIAICVLFHSFKFIYFIFEINVYLVTNNSNKVIRKKLVFNTDFIYIRPYRTSIF